jgi:hypothetical protein
MLGDKHDVREYGEGGREHATEAGDRGRVQMGDAAGEGLPKCIGAGRLGW